MNQLCRYTNNQIDEGTGNQRRHEKCSEITSSCISNSTDVKDYYTQTI